MKVKRILFILFLFANCIGYGQNTILFQENFESGGSSFSLNFPGPTGSTNTGTNKWIVNSNYTGGIGFPNTMSEDSTYGGTISFAPYSGYMHIYDASSAYTDCLYNPANASDRFAYTQAGACTFGYDSVKVNFFYLCQGSASAYGAVYYSADNGPWTQCGAAQYNNKYKWQYASISNPAFNNVHNLRIGFRWQNNAGAGTDTSGFAIDDFSMVGTFDTVHGGVGITPTVTPDTICAGGGSIINLQMVLSDTLCDGNYLLVLSDSTGNFANSPASWSYSMYYPQLNSGFIPLEIPDYITPGHCYKYRVQRTTPPAIIGVATGCIYIERCPPVITTLQPLVTTDSLNPVCTGSVIQVPFWSVGDYGNTNTYIAELSDSSGSFSTYSILGYDPSNSAFPQYASPPVPGVVSGQIPLNIPAGCHYYIRVVSDTPNTTGATFGPFCIQHCDIWTDSGASVQACIRSCYKDPSGFTEKVKFTAHKYDSNEHYTLTNKYEVQLLSTMNFSVVNTGAFGAMLDTTTGYMNVHIPCDDSLCNILGIAPTTYYMRFVATHSNQPDSMLGSLVFLKIGDPRDSSVIYAASGTSTYCLNDVAGFYAEPYSGCSNNWTTSTYNWFDNNTLFPISDFYLSLIMNSPGSFFLIVQENNNGCNGPYDSLAINIEGPPSVAITGPIKVCVGDTIEYSVPFANNTIYQWSTTNPSQVSIVDTANNLLKVIFKTAATYSVNVTGFDSCGFAPGTKRVIVIARPVPVLTGPTSFCQGTSVALDMKGGTGGGYTWSPATYLSCSHCANPTANPPGSMQYTVAVSNGTCSVNDTVKLTQYPVSKDTVCCSQTISAGQSVPLILAPGSVNETYTWAPAASLSCNTCIHTIATPSVTTSYSVTILDTTDNCTKIDSVTITVKENCGSIFVPTAFSPNGDGQNDVLLVKGPPCLASFDFIVYDRWGNKVFETTDINAGWDGKFNGVAMNTGTYVYYISALTNETPAQIISKKGNITLIR